MKIYKAELIGSLIGAIIGTVGYQIYCNLKDGNI